ncbi:MAG: CDP-alcohol phosphatidyltransferase family protein [Candidatus Thorarchaeota archaeon]
MRQQYQQVMTPVGKALARTGITPNMITGLTLVVAMFAAYLFYLGELLIGLAVMILTVVLDMFDGAVARAANLGTPFGATFDHTLDRYTEFFFLLGLMMGPIGGSEPYIPWFWGFFTLFGMIMASFTRAKAESVGGMDNCAVGIAERQEKLILQIAGILLLAIPATNIWTDFLNAISVDVATFFLNLQIYNILTLLIVVVGVLSHITVAQRLAYARKVILAPEDTETSDD